MKINFITRVALMLLLHLLVFSDTRAQQIKKVESANTSRQLLSGAPGIGSYTYKLFVAPNKVFGYYILQGSKVIFLQPALPAGNQSMALIKRPQAEKAATMAIEKIKKGMPAELTTTELRQITAQ